MICDCIFVSIFLILVIFVDVKEVRNSDSRAVEQLHFKCCNLRIRVMGVSKGL